MTNTTDNRNILDKYKNDRFTKWSTELIKKDLQSKSFPYAVLMENFAGDFNIGTVIRSANAFNARAVYYLGRKHYDRRGTVGTHNYTDVIHLKTRDQLLKLKEDYELVAVENTVPSAVSLDRAKYDSLSCLYWAKKVSELRPKHLKYAISLFILSSMVLLEASMLLLLVVSL